MTGDRCKLLVNYLRFPAGTKGTVKKQRRSGVITVRIDGAKTDVLLKPWEIEIKEDMATDGVYLYD